MSATLAPELKKVTLPSDQDATGRTLGAEEIAAISEAIHSGTLTATKGKFSKEFETKFAALLGRKYAHACSSGSAAIHCAVAALNLEPGDEVITTSITDMGALAPILFQGAIPVFCDVDPRTGNVTDDSIAACLSERTKAIVVTHLFGNPCDMTAIMTLAKSKNLPVIEDCAQAFEATHNGQKIGTFGDLAAFSLQQGKHITTGEGGLVVTNNPELARRVFLFINKAWGYGDANPDHYFLALNYRISELQSACAVAQLPKLAESVRVRTEAADWLSSQLQGLPGIETPWVDERNTHVYWKYCLMVDPAVIKGGAVGMAKLLKERGIASAPRYIQKPAFRCQVFAEQKTFGNSRWPFTLARTEAVNYDAAKFKGTFEMLERVLVLPWNERYEQVHLDYIAANVKEAAEALR
ncbi:DegT/DnrJ/EryC1/StrS family aminotransferase [Telmatocola sphagniphila]|uniref:DegT/DnrJ/EryC1/StrS family aminotransferase n=1 Tax=Telmatocola sphagniphila TaxID=1123043 RepID=A0A8E6B4G6_9BACT|nr:DegT/DnrJ/EryC1/StrS family aminotransferase [Telmatocola sphagniphila]QVL31134.1 DegT/DnrJ/EryC1/StrS family aminotransferase [Telmatocola sphagniphila]